VPNTKRYQRWCLFVVGVLSTPTVDRCTLNTKETQSWCLFVVGVFSTPLMHAKHENMPPLVCLCVQHPHQQEGFTPPSCQVFSALQRGPFIEFLYLLLNSTFILFTIKNLWRCTLVMCDKGFHFFLWLMAGLTNWVPVWDFQSSTPCLTPQK